VYSDRIGEFNIASVHRICLDLQDAVGTESAIRKKVKSSRVADKRCSARMKGGGAEAQQAQHSLRNRSCTFFFLPEPGPGLQRKIGTGPGTTPLSTPNRKVTANEMTQTRWQPAARGGPACCRGDLQKAIDVV
jgi:hypothetical protein